MRFVLLALLAILAIHCGPAAYSPRAVLAEHDVDASTYRNLGCLELAFGAKPPVHDYDAALLVVRFGNLCLTPTAFDLRGVAISGIDRDGRASRLTLIDPRDEVQFLHIDAAARGVEKLRLHAHSPVEVVAVCVDLAGVAPGSARPPGPPYCFPVTT